MSIGAYRAKSEQHAVSYENAYARFEAYSASPSWTQTSVGVFEFCGVPIGGMSLAYRITRDKISSARHLILSSNISSLWVIKKLIKSAWFLDADFVLASSMPSFSAMRRYDFCTSPRLAFAISASLLPAEHTTARHK